MRHLLIPLLVLSISACNQGERIDTAYAPEDLLSWSHYLGDPGRTHFSYLDQIDTSNVARLQVAWTYESGGLIDGALTEIQHNALVVDSVLYGRNPILDLFAVHAGTGKPIWTRRLGRAGPRWFGKARGILRWQSDDGSDERLYAGSGFHLYAIDPASGEPELTFGDSGRVDLREDLGRDPAPLTVSMNTPGAVFEDLIIVGTRVHETPGAAPGFVRAYDARSGAVRWTFHTIPQPGEFGYDTWPQGAHETAGGANSWAGMSIDHERGLLFVPTGSASYDYYGGDRPGNNLFANSLLALDARTGERVWHQQLVRHDLWDRDLPAPPNLIMLERNGKLVPAVAQITKDAHVWVFHRETGEPLFPIREFEVPASDLTGEWTAPTQRLPERPAPFGRQQVSESDLYRPDDPIVAERLMGFDTTTVRQTVREYFRTIRSSGQFEPPSLEGTVIFPGLDGGGEWGGAAVDPRNGIMYTNGSEMPWIADFDEVDPDASVGEILFDVTCTRCHGGGSGIGPDLTGVGDRLSADSIGTVIRAGRNAMPANPQYSEEELAALVSYLQGEREEQQVGADFQRPLPYRFRRAGRLMTEDGNPIIKPPWGLLTAIDLNSGDHLWQVPLGNDPTVNDPEYPVTGRENYGGSIVTAGGLIFIAATKDEKFRAFNAETGEQLWEVDLPAGGYATPATYEWGGRQYVVIACGGGKMGTPTGDTYIAFALE